MREELVLTRKRNIIENDYDEKKEWKVFKS
jgi:hypothetical protein